MENLHIYNSMLSCTSTGATIDYSVMDGRGPYTFCIIGANYHQIGLLMPSEGHARDLQNFIFMMRSMSLRKELMLLGGEAI